MSSKKLNHEIALSACETIYSNRKRLGITQIDLAKALGISQGYLSKIERGKNEPSLASWLLFCDLARLDPNDPIKPHAKAAQSRLKHIHKK